jgi:hypothetical protein
MNGHGGGLNGCNCELINCTIAGNIARGPGSGLYSCNGPKTNCIIWGNSTYSGTSEQLDESTAPTYSCIQDWTFGGVGNIDTDPQFVSGPLGDYYLSQILAGQGSDSSCLDAGSDAAENLGLTDFTTRTDEVGDGVVVDMGYHYSMPSPADINGDGRVDHLDFAIMSSQWDGLGGAPSADIVPVGGNGVVNIDDLYKLCMYWLWSE